MRLSNQAIMFSLSGALLQACAASRARRRLTLAGSALGLAAGYAAWAVYNSRLSSPARSLSGMGYVGRGSHPLHPNHPYANGVPAVWGGRRLT